MSGNYHFVGFRDPWTVYIGPSCFSVRLFRHQKIEYLKSVSLLISSFDSIDETEMDFGLTFTMFQKWQEWIHGLVSLAIRKLTLIMWSIDP